VKSLPPLPRKNLADLGPNSAMARVALVGYVNGGDSCITVLFKFGDKRLQEVEKCSMVLIDFDCANLIVAMELVMETNRSGRVNKHLK